uniref:Uncharacterized protein n=1 Tax=Rhizophagus irregularis (strain DAOM 181602 / DAOM 197198 / MUCL 43194) TaxID=747089 RepID=U9TIV6_RHIID
MNNGYTASIFDCRERNSNIIVPLRIWYEFPIIQLGHKGNCVLPESKKSKKNIVP